MARTRPALREVAASACGTFTGALENTRTISEWICRRVTSRHAVAPFALALAADFAAVIARKNELRLRSTVSRESQSVKPRYSAALRLMRLSPATRVLNPCKIHGIESKSLAVAISSPEMLRRTQSSEMRNGAEWVRGWH